MKNTITVSVQDDFWENRAHGDTTFPCAAYYTDANTHDIRWHWHEEYELSIVRSGSCSHGRKSNHQPLRTVMLFLSYRNVTFSGNDQGYKRFLQRKISFMDV